MGRAQIANPHARKAGANIVKFGRRSPAKINDPIIHERPAVVDANENASTVFQVCDFGDGGDRQGGMGRRHEVLIEDLSIRGGPTMKGWSIPGSDSNFVISVIPNRVVCAPRHRVRLADLLVLR